MSKLTDAIALSGALDPAMMRELNKWKLPATVPEGAPYQSSEEAVAAIEDAQTSYDQVEVRVSDPDVLKQFMRTKKAGKLVLVSEDETARFDWEFGKSPTGDYILQWNDTVETDLLCNGESYLLDEKQRVYFTRVQDLYFGEKRLFILCTPRKNSHAPTHTS